MTGFSCLPPSQLTITRATDSSLKLLQTYAKLSIIFACKYTEYTPRKLQQTELLQTTTVLIIIIHMCFYKKILLLLSLVVLFLFN